MACETNTSGVVIAIRSEHAVVGIKYMGTVGLA